MNQVDFVPITLFATLAGIRLVIAWNPYGRAWQARLEAEVKRTYDDHMLTGTWGGGRTPQAALEALCVDLNEKYVKLVLDATLETRREVDLPKLEAK